LSGSTLNSMDVLDLMRRVPADLRVGDVLVLCDAGAYSLARATTYACEPPRMLVLESRDSMRAVSSEARAKHDAQDDQKASAIG
jgi:hypothetical protein